MAKLLRYLFGDVIRVRIGKVPSSVNDKEEIGEEWLQKFLINNRKIIANDCLLKTHKPKIGIFGKTIQFGRNQEPKMQLPIQYNDSLTYKIYHNCPTEKFLDRFYNTIAEIIPKHITKKKKNAKGIYHKRKTKMKRIKAETFCKNSSFLKQKPETKKETVMKSVSKEEAFKNSTEYIKNYFMNCGIKKICLRKIKTKLGKNNTKTFKDKIHNHTKKQENIGRTNSVNGRSLAVDCNINTNPIRSVRKGLSCITSSFWKPNIGKKPKRVIATNNNSDQKTDVISEIYFSGKTTGIKERPRKLKYSEIKNTQQSTKISSLGPSKEANKNATENKQADRNETPPKYNITNETILTENTLPTKKIISKRNTNKRNLSKMTKHLTKTFSSDPYKEKRKTSTEKEQAEKNILSKEPSLKAEVTNETSLTKKVLPTKKRLSKRNYGEKDLDKKNVGSTKKFSSDPSKEKKKTPTEKEQADNKILSKEPSLKAEVTNETILTYKALAKMGLNKHNISKKEGFGKRIKHLGETFHLNISKEKNKTKINIIKSTGPAQKLEEFKNVHLNQKKLAKRKIFNKRNNKNKQYLGKKLKPLFKPFHQYPLRKRNKTQNKQEQHNINVSGKGSAQEVEASEDIHLTNKIGVRKNNRDNMKRKKIKHLVSGYKPYPLKKEKKHSTKNERRNKERKVNMNDKKNPERPQVIKENYFYKTTLDGINKLSKHYYMKKYSTCTLGPNPLRKRKIISIKKGLHKMSVSNQEPPKIPEESRGSGSSKKPLDGIKSPFKHSFVRQDYKTKNSTKIFVPDELNKKKEASSKGKLPKKFSSIEPPKKLEITNIDIVKFFRRKKQLPKKKYIKTYCAKKYGIKKQKTISCQNKEDNIKKYINYPWMKGKTRKEKKDPSIKKGNLSKKAEYFRKKQIDPNCKVKQPCSQTNCNNQVEPWNKIEYPCQQVKCSYNKMVNPWNKAGDSCKKQTDPCYNIESPYKQKEESCTKRVNPCNKLEYSYSCKMQYCAGSINVFPSKMNNEPLKNKPINYKTKVYTSRQINYMVLNFSHINTIYKNAKTKCGQTLLGPIGKITNICKYSTDTFTGKEYQWIKNDTHQAFSARGKAEVYEEETIPPNKNPCLYDSYEKGIDFFKKKKSQAKREGDGCKEMEAARIIEIDHFQRKESSKNIQDPFEKQEDLCVRKKSIREKDLCLKICRKYKSSRKLKKNIIRPFKEKLGTCRKNGSQGKEERNSCDNIDTTCIKKAVHQVKENKDDPWKESEDTGKESIKEKYQSLKNEERKSIWEIKPYRYHCYMKESNPFIIREGQGKKDLCKEMIDTSVTKADSCQIKKESSKNNKQPCKDKEDPCKSEEESGKVREHPCEEQYDPSKRKESSKNIGDSCKTLEDPCKRDNELSGDKEYPVNEQEEHCKNTKEHNKDKGDPSEVQDNFCKQKTESDKINKDLLEEQYNTYKWKNSINNKEEPCEIKADPCKRKQSMKYKFDPCDVKHDPCIRCVFSKDEGEPCEEQKELYKWKQLMKKYQYPCEEKDRGKSKRKYRINKEDFCAEQEDP